MAGRERHGWDAYENAAERGPVSLGIKIMVGIVILAVIGGAMSYALGWIGEGAQVAKEEYGPRAALRKYEWFKDAAQQLQAKKANIDASVTDLAAAKAEWASTPPSQIPRDAREAADLRRKEILGLKASFNTLAAEYNANVRKVNWSAMNTEGLPAEYTTYIDQ